jgi:hypothetical protein
MKSFNDVNLEELELLDVEQIRAITATDQELYERALNDLTQNAMSTMVANATNQGAQGYAIQIIKENNGKSNLKLVQEFAKTFEELGYNVDQEESTALNNHNTPVEVINVHIEWK